MLILFVKRFKNLVFSSPFFSLFSRFEEKSLIRINEIKEIIGVIISICNLSICWLIASNCFHIFAIIVSDFCGALAGFTINYFVGFTLAISKNTITDTMNTCSLLRFHISATLIRVTVL